MLSCKRIEALLLLPMLCACAPLTTYRNSALTPEVRPIDWDGVPAERGELRADASASFTSVLPNLFPTVGQSALQSATTMVDGSVGIGIVRGLELGVRGSFAAPGWNEPSASGVMPIPGGGPLWGIGPEVRGAIYTDRDERFSLGIAANVMAYSVPTATWELSDSCTPSTTCVTATSNTGHSANYTLIDQSSTALLAFNAGFYPSFAIGDRGQYGHAFAMLGFHSGFANDGFSDTPPISTSNVWTSGVVGMAGAGYSLHLASGLRVGGMIFAPFTNVESAVDQRPGLMLTIGWGGKGSSSSATPPIPKG